MNIISLASGSKGNLVYLKIENKNILIDIGLSYKKIVEKLNFLNLKPDDIDYCFITHEHQDHGKGVELFLKNTNKPKLFTTKGTYFGLLEKGFIKSEKEIISKTNFLKYYEKIKIDVFSITIIKNSHDAYEPFGIVFEYQDKKIVVITDTGYIPEENICYIKNANIYYLESNYDEQMLSLSKRPIQTKLRISSNKGHLSNTQASKLIDLVMSPVIKTKWIIAHISEECNIQSKIERAILENIKNIDNLEIYFTSQEIGKIIND